MAGGDAERRADTQGAAAAAGGGAGVAHHDGDVAQAADRVPGSGRAYGPLAGGKPPPAHLPELGGVYGGAVRPLMTPLMTPLMAPLLIPLLLG
eukprot:4411426-Pyramimonas_sp.AAC.1